MTSDALVFADAHPPGMAGVGYVVNGASQSIISCGQDGQLWTHNASDLSDKSSKSMQAEKVACHCLAVNPAHPNFAAGDQAHFVKVSSSNCTKAMLPLLRCIINEMVDCRASLAYLLLNHIYSFVPSNAGLHATRRYI